MYSASDDPDAGGNNPTTFASVFFKCSTPHASDTFTFGKMNPPSACGFSVSSADCNVFKFFPPGARSALAVLSLIDAATIPLPVLVKSLMSGINSPACGEFGPVMRRIAFAPCSRASIALYRGDA